MTSSPNFCVVLDSGGYSIKVILNDLPVQEFPNLTISSFPDPTAKPQMEFGSKVLPILSTLSPSHVIHKPMQFGYVTNFDLQAAIWHYILGPDELDIIPAESRCIFPQPPFNFEWCRKQSVSTLIKNFHLSACAFPVAAFLSMIYGSASYPNFFNLDKCCVVVDMGFSSTWVSVFFQGRIVLKACKRLDVGGDVLTKYLEYRLKLKNVNMNYFQTNEIKHGHCRVSSDFINEVDVIQPVLIENDTHSFMLDTELITVPELYFKPYLASINQMGLHELIVHLIDLVPVEEVQKYSLFSNILLVGGSSLFPGLKQRLTEELDKQTPCSVSVEIYHPENPRHATVIGGQLWSRQPDSVDVSVIEADLQYKWHSYSWKTDLR
ncbi:hypothetical protein GEMRC1_004196 [Eukaryota sp. GEM-RC1]